MTDQASELVEMVERFLRAEEGEPGLEEFLRASLGRGFRLRRSAGDKPTIGRNEFLAGLKSSPSLGRRLVSDTVKTFVGSEVGVVAGSVEIRVGDTPDYFENTWVFTNDDGAWKCASWQSSATPGEKPEIFESLNDDDLPTIERFAAVPTDARVSKVFFPAGTRTRWHRHTGRQVLIPTSGHGFLHRMGEVGPIDLNVGDVQVIEANQEHWHGARDDKTFEHIVVTSGETIPGPRTR